MVKGRADVSTPKPDALPHFLAGLRPRHPTAAAASATTMWRMSFFASTMCPFVAATPTFALNTASTEVPSSVYYETVLGRLPWASAVSNLTKESAAAMDILCGSVRYFLFFRR